MTIPKNSICTGCTLLCDDVDFEVNGATIAADVDCGVAQSFIKNANQRLSAAPAHKQNIEELSKTIAGLLVSADAPLIVGLNHLTTEAQQLAWQIADVANATIDVTLSKANRASIYALQRQGKVTATIGEIANRSDLVVFWFCDPVTSHPRLIERLTRTKSAIKKRIVVVGDSSSATAQIADEVIAVEDDGAGDFIRDLRLAIGNEEDSPKLASEEARPQARHQASTLARLLKGSSYGSWIYGHTDVSAERDDVTLASQMLVRELNDHTRFISLALRADQNGASGENVLSALSGFPVAVDLSMSIPQYNGAEYAAETVLENGECDFVLLFAGWGTSGEVDILSPAAKATLAKTPKAIISSATALDLDAEVSVQVDLPGVSESGEFCRVDDVSLAVGALTARQHGSATDFLKMLFDRLCSQ